MYAARRFSCPSLFHPSTKRLLGAPCRTEHRSESWAIPSLCHATPSATSEHLVELLGSSPIPRSFVASCVSFQLRLLPSTGVTRLHRYNEPLRHPSQPGRSLTSCQLIRTAITAGTSRVAHGPLCLHAVANTPAGRMEFIRSYGFHFASAFPETRAGRLLHHYFRGLLSVHSRYGLHARRVALATLCTRGFSSLVASTAALIATGWSEPVPGRVYPRCGPAPSRRTRVARHPSRGRRSFQFSGRSLQRVGDLPIPDRVTYFGKCCHVVRWVGAQDNQVRFHSFRNAASAVRISK